MGYEFPDEEDIPKIRATGGTVYERKQLFVQYRPDEWDDQETAERFIETFNWMLGPEIQVCVVPDRLETLTEDEVRDVLAHIHPDENP